MTIRLMLVGGHTMVRQGLARSLGERCVEIVGEARDGDESVPFADARDRSQAVPQAVCMGIVHID